MDAFVEESSFLVKSLLKALTETEPMNRKPPCRYNFCDVSLAENSTCTVLGAISVGSLKRTLYTKRIQRSPPIPRVYCLNVSSCILKVYPPGTFRHGTRCVFFLIFQLLELFIKITLHPPLPFPALIDRVLSCYYQ